MIDENRLTILTNGAKYDVSCSSSGSKRKNKSGGLGNASFGGKFIGTDDTVKVKTMLIAAENRNNPQQLSMFVGDAAISALNGEL